MGCAEAVALLSTDEDDDDADVDVAVVQLSIDLQQHLASPRCFGKCLKILILFTRSDELEYSLLLCECVFCE